MRTRIPVVLVVILVAITAWAVSSLPGYRAGTAPVPEDQSARDLEQAERKWRDQERHHMEEMVKARMDLAEQEDQLHFEEREWSSLKSDLSKLCKAIKAHLPGKVPQAIQDEEKKLRGVEQLHRAALLDVRQRFFTAQERIWLLEREQARQRGRLRARLDAAEANICSNQRTMPGKGSPDLQRSLQEVERTVERLRREIAELHRQIQRQPR